MRMMMIMTQAVTIILLLLLLLFSILFCAALTETMHVVAFSIFCFLIDDVLHNILYVLVLHTHTNIHARTRTHEINNETLVIRLLCAVC